MNNFIKTRKDIVFWSIWTLLIIWSILSIFIECINGEIIPFVIIVIFSILIIAQINIKKFRNWLETEI